MQEFVLMFPGQGSQEIGMGRDLQSKTEVARNVFETVDDTLNRDNPLSDLIFNGSHEELSLTCNTQPAIMAASIASWKTMEMENFPRSRIKCIIGHSLGEYSALCAANSISLEDTTKLLDIRAHSMQSAVPAGQGGMIALLGATQIAIEELIKNIASDECEIANYNGGGQFVISGSTSAINKIINYSRENKIAKRIIRLDVSAPFHSKMIESAENEMKKAFTHIKIQKPQYPFMSCVTCQFIDDIEDLRSTMIKQVTSPVYWEQAILKIAALIDIEKCTFVEVGPGNILSRLVKKIIPNINTYQTRDMNDIKELIVKYNEAI